MLWSKNVDGRQMSLLNIARLKSLRTLFDTHCIAYVAEKLEIPLARKIPSIAVGTHHSSNVFVVLNPLSINGFISAGNATSVDAVMTIAPTDSKNPGQ